MTAKKKAAKAKGCNCREQVNKQLIPHNTTIHPVMLIDFTARKAHVGMEVLTTKLDSKKSGRKKCLLCVYCPFCGKKLIP